MIPHITGLSRVRLTIIILYSFRHNKLFALGLYLFLFRFTTFDFISDPPCPYVTVTPTPYRPQYNPECCSFGRCNSIYSIILIPINILFLYVKNWSTCQLSVKWWPIVALSFVAMSSFTCFYYSKTMTSVLNKTKT